MWSPGRLNIKTNILLNPPPFIIFVFVVLLLIFLRKKLRKDHFYTLVFSSLISFLLAEGGCRILDIGNPQVPVIEEMQARNQKYGYKPDGKLLYRYPDNPRGYFNDSNEVPGSINSMGFRGSEVTQKKADGITRFAFLGDSFTLGMGVRDEDTFPASFERLIRKRFPATEVLNFGISGTSTARHIRLLEEYVLSFEPDVVVMVLFLNDADRTGTIRFLSRPRILASLRENSYFINALLTGIEKPRLSKKMVRHYREGYKADSEGWSTVREELEKGKALSEQHDFELIAAVYPVLYKLDEGYPFAGIHTTIQDYCLSIGIPFVDLVQGFLGKKDSELWVHRTDQHPNEQAHKIAAEQLYEYFENKGGIFPGKGQNQQ